MFLKGTSGITPSLPQNNEKSANETITPSNNPNRQLKSSYRTEPTSTAKADQPMS
jgi:hypothetical protein